MRIYAIVDYLESHPRPADGNHIMSVRSQGWVIKIDYANGAGDGHVVWRLGRRGHFRLRSSVPDPWFSHQHDVRYVNNTTLVLFDEANTRRRHNPRAQSRRQVLILKEKTMRARLVAHSDLGNYAPAPGSAQMLPNGYLDFDSGFAEQTIEVRPHRGKTYVLRMNMPGKPYRSSMYANLYANPSNIA